MCVRCKLYAKKAGTPYARIDSEVREDRQENHAIAKIDCAMRPICECPENCRPM